MFRWLKQQKSIEELEERCEKLEKRQRDIDLEWDQVYEKFRLLNMRLSKRVKQLDQAPVETGDPQPEGGSVDAQGPSNSMLSPRARSIQAQILARRNRQVNGGTE